MDPITHALFGVSAANLSTRKNYFMAASICGIIGGMMPDIDIIIRSESNPLLWIKYHRHFTHALLFAPIGGLISAALCWLLIRKHLAFRYIYLFCTIGFAVHGPLDALTSYGTHLFWPLSNERTAWNTIAIIDPLVTLPLLFGAVMAFWRSNRAWIAGCLAFALLYLSFGYLQNTRVTEAMRQVAAQQGHTIDRYILQPTMFNTILWRTVYVSNGQLYANGFRSGLAGNITHYPGPSTPVLDMERDLPAVPPNSVAARDIELFTFFSGNLAGLKPDDKQVVGDYRYSLLPNQLGPIWGIRVDPDYPDRHVQFENFRKITPEDWRDFKRMLMDQYRPDPIR